MDLHFEHKLVYYWHSHVYELVDRVVMVSPGDSVLSATKKMVEVHASSAVVAVWSKAQGILTSVDLYLNYSCALLSCMHCYEFILKLVPFLVLVLFLIIYNA